MSMNKDPHLLIERSILFPFSSSTTFTDSKDGNRDEDDISHSTKTHSQETSEFVRLSLSEKPSNTCLLLHPFLPIQTFNLRNKSVISRVRQSPSKQQQQESWLPSLIVSISCNRGKMHGREDSTKKFKRAGNWMFS